MSEKRRKVREVFLFDAAGTKERYLYFHCFCGLCGVNDFVNCGTDPKRNDIIYAVNGTGWRYFYDYTSKTPEKLITVCPECAVRITGDDDAARDIVMYREHLEGNLTPYIMAENQKTFEKCKMKYGVVNNQQEEEDNDE